MTDQAMLTPGERTSARAYFERMTRAELDAAAERHAEIASRKNGHSEEARAAAREYGALVLEEQARRARGRR